MGITYEGTLAIADLEQLRDAMVRIGEVGLLAPIAAQRVAVLPTETYGGVADVEEYAADISAAAGCSVLAHGVYDSDVLKLWVYRDGELVHRYVSDIGTEGSVFEDHDGLMKVELDGVVYLESDPNRPRGPVGASAEAFADFGTGTVSREALLEVLADEQPGRVLSRHREFLDALNIDSIVLHDTYDRIEASEVAGAVLVTR
ncbi:MAG TPA: hypothetical protein VL551_01035 [Actinospica sp.]|nr:hypothetical protein [Actinospica sp.]